MEFEQLQEIWDVQNSQYLYGFDSQAIHQKIIAKRRGVRSFASKSELLLMLVNFGGGLFILAINADKMAATVFVYVMSAWMLFTGLYILQGRIARIRGERQFDRSMIQDLQHAISIATYQVRLSQATRWNILPLGGLCLLALWDGGKAPWLIGLFVALFCLSFFVSRYEHSIYVRRRKDLQILLSKLSAES